MWLISGQCQNGVWRLVLTTWELFPTVQKRTQPTRSGPLLSTFKLGMCFCWRHKLMMTFRLKLRTGRLTPFWQGRIKVLLLLKRQVTAIIDQGDLTLMPTNIRNGVEY